MTKLTKEELKIKIKDYFILSFKDREVMSTTLLAFNVLFDDSFITDKLIDEKLDSYIDYYVDLYNELPIILLREVLNRSNKIFDEFEEDDSSEKENNEKNFVSKIISDSILIFLTGYILTGVLSVDLLSRISIVAFLTGTFLFVLFMSKAFILVILISI